MATSAQKRTASLNKIMTDIRRRKHNSVVVVTAPVVQKPTARKLNVSVATPIAVAAPPPCQSTAVALPSTNRKPSITVATPSTTSEPGAAPPTTKTYYITPVSKSASIVAVSSVEGARMALLATTSTPLVTMVTNRSIVAVTSSNPLIACDAQAMSITPVTDVPNEKTVNSTTNQLSAAVTGSSVITANSATYTAGAVFKSSIGGGGGGVALYTSNTGSVVYNAVSTCAASSGSSGGGLMLASNTVTVSPSLIPVIRRTSSVLMPTPTTLTCGVLTRAPLTAPTSVITAPPAPPPLRKQAVVAVNQLPHNNNASFNVTRLQQQPAQYLSSAQQTTISAIANMSAVSVSHALSRLSPAPPAVSSVITALLTDTSAKPAKSKANSISPAHSGGVVVNCHSNSFGVISTLATNKVPTSTTASPLLTHPTTTTTAITTTTTTTTVATTPVVTSAAVVPVVVCTSNTCNSNSIPITTATPITTNTTPPPPSISTPLQSSTVASVVVLATATSEDKRPLSSSTKHMTPLSTACVTKAVTKAVTNAVTKAVTKAVTTDVTKAVITTVTKAVTTLVSPPAAPRTTSTIISPIVPCGNGTAITTTTTNTCSEQVVNSISSGVEDIEMKCTADTAPTSMSSSTPSPPSSTPPSSIALVENINVGSNLKPTTCEPMDTS